MLRVSRRPSQAICLIFFAVHTCIHVRTDLGSVGLYLQALGRKPPASCDSFRLCFFLFLFFLHFFLHFVRCVYRQAVDELNKKDYALKMIRIPRGRSGQLANEEVRIFCKEIPSTTRFGFSGGVGGGGPEAAIDL